MFLRIESIEKRKLVGKSVRMSLQNDQTFSLWHSFMKEQKQIRNRINDKLYSIQRYDNFEDSKNFSPDTVFEKSAALEVSDYAHIPEGFVAMEIKEGQYAVFLHKGLASNFPITFQYIFEKWLPNSDYILDNRAHFEVLGKKYKNNHPDSEEEIWIPVQSKKVS